MPNVFPKLFPFCFTSEYNKKINDSNQTKKKEDKDIIIIINKILKRWAFGIWKLEEISFNSYSMDLYCVLGKEIDCLILKE